MNTTASRGERELGRLSERWREWEIDGKEESERESRRKID